MKISQENVILIKHLCLSKQYGAQRLLSELPDKGWKRGSVDSLLKRIHKTGNCADSSRLRSACSSGGPCAQSGGQAKKAWISSWEFAWNYHSPFKCVQDNSLWSIAQILQTMSCSAATLNQPHLPSHSLINNLIVCNKSCYCSIHKL